MASEERPDVVDEMEDDELGSPAPTAPGRVTGSSTFPCPYCGTENEPFLEPDLEGRAQDFTEECEACGRTYAVSVEFDRSGRPTIHAERTE